MEAASGAGYEPHEVPDLLITADNPRVAFIQAVPFPAHGGPSASVAQQDVAHRRLGPRNQARGTVAGNADVRALVEENASDAVDEVVVEPPSLGSDDDGKRRPDLRRGS